MDKMTKMCVWSDGIAAVYEFDLERRAIKRLTPLFNYSKYGIVKGIDLIDPSDLMSEQQLNIVREHINSAVTEDPNSYFCFLLKEKERKMQVTMVSISAEDYERFLQYEKIVKELQNAYSLLKTKPL